MELPNSSTSSSRQCDKCYGFIREDYFDLHQYHCHNTISNDNNYSRMTIPYEFDPVTKVDCPICEQKIREDMLNEHLDSHETPKFKSPISEHYNDEIKKIDLISFFDRKQRYLSIFRLYENITNEILPGDEKITLLDDLFLKIGKKINTTFQLTSFLKQEIWDKEFLYDSSVLKTGKQEKTTRYESFIHFFITLLKKYILDVDSMKILLNLNQPSLNEYLKFTVSRWMTPSNFSMFYDCQPWVKDHVLKICTNFPNVESLFQALTVQREKHPISNENYQQILHYYAQKNIPGYLEQIETNEMNDKDELLFMKESAENSIIEFAARGLIQFTQIPELLLDEETLRDTLIRLYPSWNPVIKMFSDSTALVQIPFLSLLEFQNKYFGNNKLGVCVLPWKTMFMEVNDATEYKRLVCSLTSDEFQDYTFFQKMYSGKIYLQITCNHIADDSMLVIYKKIMNKCGK